MCRNRKLEGGQKKKKKTWFTEGWLSPWTRPSQRSRTGAASSCPGCKTRLHVRRHQEPSAAGSGPHFRNWTSLSGLANGALLRQWSTGGGGGSAAIVYARPHKQRKCTSSEGWLLLLLLLTWNQHRSRLQAATTPGSAYRCVITKMSPINILRNTLV
jgi:hypothetical protein